MSIDNSYDPIKSLNPGEMLYDANRCYIGMGKEAYQKLEEFLPAVERYSLESLFIEGYRHLILDWPTNKFIAVYIHTDNKKKD